ncbi:MAG: cation diffusion facilitator family transporter [Candidatus Omnitrophica bacterium]|nr:cation diffusion facilitator family transporter [Candidatus Omnitrophota bacterium]
MEHGHDETTAATQELFEYRAVERRKLKICMVITGVVMLVELAGGIASRSLALISDAGHMFTHFFSLAVSFGAIVCANTPTCHHRTFGLQRAEILAALFNSLFLFAVTGWILYEGVRRILAPVEVVTGQMLGIALIGLVVNALTLKILHGAHRHDLNIRGAVLHLVGDLFSSVAVVAGAVIIHFTGLHVIDPLLSILIAGIILFWGWGLFRDAVHILLEGAPIGLSSDEVMEAISRTVPEIEAIEEVRLWTITSKMHAMTMRVKLREDLNRGQCRETVRRIKRVGREKFRITYSTIEIQ